MPENDKHRALVFQGGGALGAYVAGVYHEIYSKVSKEDPGDRLFDVIAGTSIGAINSAILVGHYLRNGNSWEGSAEKLREFWQGLMSPTIADSLIGENPFVCGWWDFMHAANPCIADAESAKRFWSIFEFAFTTRGVPRIYQPVPQWGSKFLNPFADFLPWWRYDYQRLKEYLSEFVDFPIKTSLEEGQPRLLLTSVDIQDYSTAVVFDSYEKLHDASAGDNVIVGNGKGRWFSEYGDVQNQHVVFYDGIGPDQVLASALGKYSLNHPTIEDAVTKTQRQLWDGGYLSNTPLRELLAAHRKYWNEYLKKNKQDLQELTEIPELEVYVINLRSSVARDIPQDKDSIDDRENDIFFHDRTGHDEMLTYLRADYVDLARKLVDLAKSNGLSDGVDEILKKEAKSISRVGGEFRFATYRDIIDGRAIVSKVWRIDRRDSSDTIFGKTTDFSPSSIRKLILDGEGDARISLDRMKILFAMEDLISDGIMSAKDGEEAMGRIRRMATVEELYKKDRAEVISVYDRFVALVESKVPKPERRQALIGPAKDMLEFLLEVDSSKIDDGRARDAPPVWRVTV